MRFLIILMPWEAITIASVLIFGTLIVWYLDEQKKKEKKEKELEERINTLEKQLKESKKKN